jgi:hypothetical protein
VTENNELKEMKAILLENNAMLKKICNQLGIGSMPPVKILELKERAKRRATEIQKKKPIR